MYDDNNIFAKIIRKEIPCLIQYMKMKKFCFLMILIPQAKIHILGIPKIPVTNLREFISKADQRHY